MEFAGESKSKDQRQYELEKVSEYGDVRFDRMSGVPFAVLLHRPLLVVPQPGLSVSCSLPPNALVGKRVSCSL